MEIEDYLGGYTNDEKKMISNALTNHNPNEMDEVFKMLFIKQTDMLSSMLPGLFEKTSEYLKLLFTPRYNHGIIKKLVDEIPEEYFDVSKCGQVSIIGWLYQFYNTELKDMAFSKKKFSTEDIPAVTQLFTTDWIVRYLVQNSLGRYWIKVLKLRGDKRTEQQIAEDFNWNYYMPSATKMYDKNKPKVDKIEDIKFIDPAMGSGHILIYAFEVFFQIYKSEGYNSNYATTLIVERNLYGLDIDFRAYQLAYFAIMMKARKYDQQALTRDWKLNIFSIPVSYKPSVEDYLKNENMSYTQKKALNELISLFEKGNLYGSIIKPSSDIKVGELKQLVDKSKKIKDGQLSLNDIDYLDRINNLLSILKVTQLLLNKYEIGVTNPPYMGLRKMEEALKIYIKKNYPYNCQDLFSVFMNVMANLVSNQGYIGMITQHSWMFLQTFEKMRKNLNRKSTIVNLVDLGSGAFEEISGEVVQTAAFIIFNDYIPNHKGKYEKLISENTEESKEKLYLECKNKNLNVYVKSQTDFNKIPGSPIAYWAPEALIKDFEKGTPLEKLVDAKQGLATANNKLFLRYWYEVDVNKICFNAHNTEEAVESGKKWFPYNKGGAYRKWYGNYDYVVNWEKNGKEIKNYTDKNGKLRSRPQNTDYYFKEALTWSNITSGPLSARYRTFGSIHDVAGMSAFKKNGQFFRILGLVNSKVGNYIFKILNPTINTQIGNFLKLPYLNITNSKIEQYVKQNVEISKKDWDSNEISWEYDHNGLLNSTNSLEVSYEKYHNELARKFKQEQKNEEEINKFFIDIYKLNNELDYSVEPKNISLKDPNKVNEKKTEIKNFLSYFVGCLFGRYSLDKDGLIFAGGQFDLSNYKSFIPNEDNIILLTDRDYFGDNRDIFNRLKEFLTITFDKEHLSENMHFIAQVLDSKKVKRGATDEQIIRNYFSNDFYKEHDEMYHKRPIYWQFTSGRNNGFKALMYLHRYNTNELAMARNYLYQLQNAYINTIKLDEERLSKVNSNRERNQYVRDIAKLKKKVNEIINYDESLNHQALAQVKIDLDDGVLVNHAKIQGKKHLLSNL